MAPCRCARRRCHGWRGRVDRVADAGDLRDRDEFDVVEDFSSLLPMYVIAELTSRLPVLNFHKFFPLLASNAIR